MKKRVKYIAVGVLLVGFGFIAGFFAHDPLFIWYWEYRETKTINKYLNKPAPNISIPQIDGTPWELSSHRGNILLLDFWATWCGPCIGKLPDLKKLYEKYETADEFQIIGISFDKDKAALLEVLETEKILWTQLFAGKNNSVKKDYSIFGIPSIWIIDKQGMVRGVNLRSNEEIEDILNKLL